MKITHRPDHAPLRRAEYPNIGDQLDAVWKALGALPASALPPETRAMLEQVQAVKARYPVSEGEASN
ncbi:hypothetical protein HTY52_12760 [Cupriavidus taiwanensis]|uniref:hypothetical protein n=1 Tax=Cupriavidus taiwanensis TaxID=164546 RepID=UPI0015741A07|nr:hypothetical protein [Cupriavidus taiwanensis]NSX14946.1 hypothetical protein [Cupriavidus taiwanensis]